MAGGAYVKLYRNKEGDTTTKEKIRRKPLEEQKEQGQGLSSRITRVPPAAAPHLNVADVF